MDPREALARTVYLLDRSLADGNRVRAYQRALVVVDELGTDAIAEHHRAGTLTDLPGIGASTGAVIAQALEGRVPDKVAELEASTRIDPTVGGELRAALRGDCHSHTTWSDGGASVREMVDAARALGHDYLVVTDHSPRLTVAHGLDRDRLIAQVAEIRALDAELDGEFRVLAGIEVDILADGTLDQDDDLLAELDVVVASVHSKLSMPAPDMTRRMVRAILNPHVDILGHCTGQKVPGRMRPIGRSDFPGRVGSSFDADMVFAACARFGTAVEINCRPERQDPPDELLALALEWDCLLAIDTDAHAPGQLEWQAFGCDRAAQAGVEAGRIVNAWDADTLVEWAAAHPTS